MIKEEELHGALIRTAIKWRTCTIGSWRMIMGSIGDFEEITNIAEKDVEQWEKLVNKK